MESLSMRMPALLIAMILKSDVGMAAL